ncbi:hypothetical protein [Aquibacillus albus]|uniref:Uncharacterized protein n=1 Tax=Aquibacillus albus TaxID=1168171 RepID=A0ABS2N2H4_9BACI|nr:hypothetical protein [Aquibacillus albus]MBM7572353.1 hypothetical protein [Aquibacillus albus]
MYNKKLTQFTKNLLLILFVFILIGCNNESPKEAINNGWSGEIEVNDIVSKQKTSDGTIVYFNAQDVDESDKFERLGIALVTSQSDTSWELIDSKISSITDESFSVRHKILRFKTDEGNVKEIPIAFGKLVDENISTVTAEVNDEVKEMEIITTDLSRYFYQVNAWGPIKGLDEKGEVIEQY